MIRTNGIFVILIGNFVYEFIKNTCINFKIYKW